jgi:hypothetical protein
MSNGVFLIVLIAIGFAMLLYFNRRAKNFQDRHPDEDNPIEQWLTGRDDREETKGEKDSGETRNK